jgi:hypothetical protein
MNTLATLGQYRGPEIPLENFPPPQFDPYASTQYSLPPWLPRIPQTTTTNPGFAGRHPLSPQDVDVLMQLLGIR